MGATSELTYRTKCYRCRCEAYQAAVPSMRLVYLVCVFMAQLIHDFGYSVMVACSERFADKAFKLESTALSLIIQLVC
jgi:hypothetical protein